MSHVSHRGFECDYRYITHSHTWLAYIVAPHDHILSCDPRRWTRRHVARLHSLPVEWVHVRPGLRVSMRFVSRSNYTSPLGIHRHVLRLIDTLAAVS